MAIMRIKGNALRGLLGLPDDVELDEVITINVRGNVPRGVIAPTYMMDHKEKLRFRAWMRNERSQQV